MTLQLIADYPSFSVVEKPIEVLSSPGKDPHQVNLVTLFRAQFPGVISHPTVHRLDLATSGIIIMAKNQRSHQNLSLQFKDRIVEKLYEAVLDGVIEEESGTIELAFSLDYENRPKQIYDPVKGKIGKTEWRRIAIENGCTRVEMKPITGRTHQLRLHSSHELGLGTPIVGDRLYGVEGERLKLHAKEIWFNHPDSGEPLHFQSEVPFQTENFQLYIK